MSPCFRLKHSSDFAFRSPRRIRGAGVDESHLPHVTGRSPAAKRLTASGVSRLPWSATKATCAPQFSFPKFSRFSIFTISIFPQAQGSYRPDQGRPTAGVFFLEVLCGEGFRFWGSVAERRRDLQTEASLTSRGHASSPSSTGPAQPCVPACSTLQPIGSVRASFLPFDQALRQPGLFWPSF